MDGVLGANIKKPLQGTIRIVQNKNASCNFSHHHTRLFMFDASIGSRQIELVANLSILFYYVVLCLRSDHSPCGQIMSLYSKIASIFVGCSVLRRDPDVDWMSVFLCAASWPVSIYIGYLVFAILIFTIEIIFEGHPEPKSLWP